METGLQEAESAFQSMLSGDTDTQQLEAEEVTEDAEIQEETEIEADSEIEAEEEESEGEEEEPEKYYRVKLGGSEVEVTLNEALKGYQRQQDYTQKTQAVADEKKQLNVELEQARQERTQYQQNLQSLLQQQQASQPAEPNWNQLYEDDPLEWVKQKEEARSRKERTLELQQQNFQMQQLQEREQQQNYRSHLAQQQEELIEAIPEWNDPKVMQTEKLQIRSYAKSLGYSDSEISNVHDRRAVQALRSGMIASGITSKGKAKLKQAKPAIRAITPGSAPDQPKRQTSIHKAKIKLAKSGKMSDATEIFKQLL